MNSKPYTLCLTSTGKERDEETGYNYHGARYYDASLLTGWLSVDPLADKYSGISPYAYCTWNPIRIVDPDGRDGWDKVAGLCIGVVTNAVPGMGGLRDAYTPTNPIDYNNALRVADNTSLVVGGLMMTAGAAGMAAGNTMMGTGAAIAVSGVGVPEGAVVVVAGGAVDAASTILGIGGAVMTARAASNSSKGYNRGSGKIESSRLTNKEVAREAEKMKMKTTKYRSHGEPVYKKGNRYYSYDNTSHKGGMWKVFELKNEKLCRIGTANKKLEIIGE